MVNLRDIKPVPKIILKIYTCIYRILERVDNTLKNTAVL